MWIVKGLLCKEVIDACTHKSWTVEYRTHAGDSIVGETFCVLIHCWLRLKYNIIPIHLPWRGHWKNKLCKLSWLSDRSIVWKNHPLTRRIRLALRTSITTENPRPPRTNPSIRLKVKLFLTTRLSSRIQKN